MIRIVLCEEKNCETVVLNNFMSLIDLGGLPKMINEYPIWFPANKHKEARVTHVAYLPEDGHRGIVTRLTRPLQVRKKDTVSFVPGGLSFIMNVSGEEMRWVEEK
jgi:hypothetical protein